MLVTSRCFRGPPRLQQEDDDQIYPDKDVPELPHQLVHAAVAQSLQPSANLFRGLSLGVKSPVKQIFRLL